MNQFDGFPHIICAQQFSRDWLEKEFLPLTDEMQETFEQGGCDTLKGKRIVSFFYEPSTRTRSSFEFAADYLGARTVFSTENAREFSSAKKGETLKDTIRVLNRYRPDAIVLRYDHEIGAKFAAEVSKAPILNAGDREPGQHPTQALLDLRTIFKRRGEIDGLKIAMVGDLLKGRTVRSLSYLLGKFKNIKIHFISPPHLGMATDIGNYLERHNVAFTIGNNLYDIASQVDVIYQTRVQKECGSEISNEEHQKGYYIVDGEVISVMKEDAIIMHPLPRVDEITTWVDEDPRAVYLTEQIDSGLFTRMALLKMILDPKKKNWFMRHVAPFFGINLA